MQSMILETSTFETAFLVHDDERDAAMRRFSTLILDIGSSRRQGSNGYVFKARNVFGEIFAVKLLHSVSVSSPFPGMMDDRETKSVVSAFHEEYETQRMLSVVKGFPKVFGYGTTKEFPVIVMEWIDGITLNELPSRIDARDRALAALQIGLALFKILSNLDIFTIRPVHRDLSPSNIMISLSEQPLEEQIESGDYDLRIIDFGSSMIVDNANPRFTEHASLLRKATPEYAPPEMLSDTLPNILELRRSPAIDIYASASIVYELLTGHTTHRIAENPQVPPYHAKSYIPEPPDLSVLMGSHDVAKMKNIGEFQNLLMRALSPDPRIRPDANLIYTSIEKVLDGESNGSFQNENKVSHIVYMPPSSSPMITMPLDPDSGLSHASVSHIRKINGQD